MKFGKQIQASHIPGWSPNYLDYKFLKKIISSLAANRPASEAAALALGVRPADILVESNTTPNVTQEIRSANVASILEGVPGQPPIQSASGQDDDRGPDFQAHKAAFFFKLERELEKINAFYLRKEAELKMRLETLLSKRRAAAMRGLPDAIDDPTQTHVEWSAVEEGFRLLERDLGKLQQFVEINGMGCRKILKKWDKRSKSSTKELYLARQVDVQPVFNRQLISELSDTVASCLLDLTDLSSGLKFEGSSATDILSQQFYIERNAHMGPFYDLQSDLRRAIGSYDQSLIKDLVHYSDILAQEPNGSKANVTRILWKVIIEAPPELADLILNSLTTPFDFNFVDDINGRSCLHEAAMSGTLRLVDMCLEKSSHRDKVDVYGRSPLHYAAMRGHAVVCRRLLEVKLPPNALDVDNSTPLVYATMKGSADCVSVLLKEAPVEVGVLSPGVDLSPLSLASQSGNVDVVLLLLQHGAKSLPNSNGEYPIHLAAREGHVDVCRLLLQQTGWDIPDKYHEWTPLFHAARNGHDSCVEVLLEAGSRLNVIDELGYPAVHYAAWYGYHACVARLLKASAILPPKNDAVTVSNTSPLSDIDIPAESDIDHIPSLSLPPPIMPHRTYGHNYLDRRYLVQVSLGLEACSDRRSGSFKPAIRLHSRLSNLTTQDHHLPASTPLKLVMTAGSDANSAPYSISLPQRDDKDVFVFQIPSLDLLSLTFSVYPNFGTKTIGRAVALPSLFIGIDNNSQFVLPILDHRLHVMGEITFEVNIVTPFKGVTLEVGGAVETYWKSMAVAIPSAPSQTGVRLPKSSRSTDSAGTSPSIQSVAASAGNALTISSLKDNYIYVVVQVTRDFHPVIFADWLLPEFGFDLGVADVTLHQFESLAARLRRDLDFIDDSTDWRRVTAGSMISLSRLMTILPVGFGVCLELAYPSSKIRKVQSLRHQLDLNSFVDAVLRTIYHTSATLGGAFARRRIVFTSFSPDACGAVNWKQPNYPVFFASQCGQKSSITPSCTALSVEDATDGRLTCLDAAVNFSKKNNLLGVFVDAATLLQVPSLIDAIRDAGLVVCVYGASEPLNIGTEGSRVDAFLQGGMVIYKERGLYG